MSLRSSSSQISNLKFLIDFLATDKATFSQRIHTLSHQPLRVQLTDWFGPAITHVDGLSDGRDAPVTGSQTNR